MIINRTLIRRSRIMLAAREEIENDRITRKHPQLRDALATRTVLAGNFEGMKYGSVQAHCSMLYPKLLGTYENEISKEIKNHIDAKPSLIVDVGAADGYYAVGLARRIPSCKVIAFELEPIARQALKELSVLNGVANQVDIRGCCNIKDLLSLPKEGGLMIVDCEGFEDELLTTEVVRHLSNWFLIIETHDGLTTGITERLESRLRETHQIKKIEVIHDLNKADHIRVDILSELSRREIDKLIAEKRQHACMRWLVCSPN